VGFILLRSRIFRGILHEVPLEISIGADTQGAIGYQIQQAMHKNFTGAALKQSVATVVTQALVGQDDPAFQKPSKPIGQFYQEGRSRGRMRLEKWTMVDGCGDAAGDAWWRRPSGANH